MYTQLVTMATTRKVGNQDRDDQRGYQPYSMVFLFKNKDIVMHVLSS